MWRAMERNSQIIHPRGGIYDIIKAAILKGTDNVRPVSQSVETDEENEVPLLCRKKF